MNLNDPKILPEIHSTVERTTLIDLLNLTIGSVSGLSLNSACR